MRNIISCKNISKNLLNEFFQGRFLDLDAEEAEVLVDKYFSAINKAAKFFSKAELKAQR